MSEQWRVIEWAPRYAVSDLGRVRNLYTGRLLKGETDRDGYRRVNLMFGRSRKARVHRLVCEAFHGSPMAGQEVRHLDGQRQNNCAANLAWGTRSENVHDAKAHGTYRRGSPPNEAMRRGEANTSSKLTDAIVAEARARHNAGESGRKLAREFGVNSGNMSAALRGATWRHVGEADAPNYSRGVSKDG